MRPEQTYLIAQQRMAEMREEADRRRLAREVAPAERPARERPRLAQLLARFEFARVKGGRKAAPQR
jgi:hypothetical protein